MFRFIEKHIQNNLRLFNFKFTPFSPLNDFSCLGFTLHRIIEFGISNKKDDSDFNSSGSESRSSISFLYNIK